MTPKSKKAVDANKLLIETNEAHIHNETLIETNADKEASNE